MEAICDPLNLEIAMARVIANGGAPGVDGITVKGLEKYFERHRAHGGATWIWKSSLGPSNVRTENHT